MFWSFLGGFLGCLVSNEHHVTHNESLQSVISNNRRTSTISLSESNGSVAPIVKCQVFRRRILTCNSMLHGII